MAHNERCSSTNVCHNDADTATATLVRALLQVQRHGLTNVSTAIRAG